MPAPSHLSQGLRRPLLSGLLLVATLLPFGARAGAEPPAPLPVVGHELTVRLDPDAGTLTGTDRLNLPPGLLSATLFLHEGLSPRVADGAAVLERVGREGHLERFRLTARAPGLVTLTWSGPIRHPLVLANEGMGRTGQRMLGTIGPDGAFLTGFTGWYPRLANTLERFTLTLDLPPGWLAVSQGEGPAITDANDRVRVTWRENQPQDEIHLNAARFRLYRQPGPTAEAQAWLRLPDDELAARYLAVTEDYLNRYAALIGPYPYSKFALVENFWESGYGMPSFTLLGPRVLRLPFILHTSYPHEILHNWWGNGVFVDYAGGNWSEGLTTYLADHLNTELEGRGEAYRRDQLAAFADHVQSEADFPVREFQGRHGGASQAIGYGKVMMIFHMLRQRYGDTAFVDALRRFYRDHRFQVAGWAEWQAAFAAAVPDAPDLPGFFAAWLDRPGAPRLALAEVAAEPLTGGGWRVRGRLAQTQAGAAFPLSVPVLIHDQDGTAHEIPVRMDGQGVAVDFTANLPAAPLRLAVDPRFDTFRELLPGEAPVRLGSLFGASGGLIVLPAAASPALAAGYRALAEAWVDGQPGWRITSDQGLESLPDGQAVWVFGWENRFAAVVGAAAAGRVVLDPVARSVTLDGQTWQGVSPVLSAAGGDGPAALGWLAVAAPAALPTLGRKLPHYGKQGWLVFDAEGAAVLARGQWPAGDSALVHWFGDARPALTLPLRPDLLQAAGAGGP